MRYEARMSSWSWRGGEETSTGRKVYRFSGKKIQLSLSGFTFSLK
jgi:hypothetical protein